MSAPQFTPGPWGAEPCDGDWNITYGSQGEHVLARVFDYASEFQGEDAALIAAAPELYEALEDALGALESAKTDAYAEWERLGQSASNPLRASLLREADAANARLIRAKAILAKARRQ